MAYDPKTGAFKPENESVSRRVTGLMSQQSPMMQQARTQGTQASNRRGLLNTSMGGQASQMAAMSAAVPIASQEAQQAQQSNMQGRDLQSQEQMQARDLQSREKLELRGLNVQKEVARANRTSQERIAKMNVAAHEREKAASLAAAFENTYGQMAATIMNNADLPAETRQQYIHHAGKVRDSNLRLVEQMYNINLNWSTPGIPSSSKSSAGASSKSSSSSTRTSSGGTSRTSSRSPYIPRRTYGEGGN